MHHLRLIDLLRSFYATRVSHIPVVAVDEEGRPTDRLEGFLSREKINREMTDLERASRELHAIPSELLIQDHFPSGLSALMETIEQIPVLDIRGQEAGSWDATRLLHAWSAFKVIHQSRGISEPEVVTPVEQESEPSEGEWLAKLILSGIPNPLFATDLEGHTLFYNQAFQERVLDGDHFKKSIRLVESYFLEVNRSLLARSLEEGQGSHGPDGIRTVWIEEISLFLRVNDLGNHARLYGYLYMFQDPRKNGAWETAEALLAAGYGLTGLLEEMESNVIYQALEMHGQNISHTAESLGLRRSTLQNRIKKLNIDERFDRRIDGPIRRARKVGKPSIPEAVEEKPVAKKSAAKKASTKSKKKAKPAQTSSAKKRRTGEKKKGTSRKKG